MEWFVYYHNFNKGLMEAYNVFNHYSYKKDLIKNAKKNKNNREEFLKQLKSDTMYYYWSKCEWEVILSPFVGKKEQAEIKIDVYDQLMLNWDRYCDYVWENVNTIRKWKD